MAHQDRIVKAFGAAVRKVRREKGISQEELGYRAGLHRTYIGAVEQGKRNITLRSAIKIASALGMQLDELIRIALGVEEEK